MDARIALALELPPGITIGGLRGDGGTSCCGFCCIWLKLARMALAPGITIGGLRGEGGTASACCALLLFELCCSCALRLARMDPAVVGGRGTCPAREGEDESSTGLSGNLIGGTTVPLPFFG